MRKLKFRFWDSRNEKMYFDTPCFGIDCNGKVSELIHGDINKNYIEWAGTIYSLNIIPLQYTGLKDKSGKEIYEGDIVEVKTISYTNCSKEEVEDIWYHEGVMEFYQNGWCIVKKTDTGKSIKNLYFSNLKNKPDDPDTDIFEVVGNIYENPELLNVD